MTAPAFKPGDKVWPKTDSPMVLQDAPQTVINAFSDPVLGDWLWLDAGSGHFGSWAAVHWTTTEPDEAELAVRRERQLERLAENARMHRVTLEERVAALEAAISMAGAEGWTDDQVAEFQAELDRCMADPGHGLRVLPHRPLLTPETARELLRECVTVVKPGEILVIRGDWTPGQVRELNDWGEWWTEHCAPEVKILFTIGEEFAVAEPEAAG